MVMKAITALSKEGKAELIPGSSPDNSDAGVKFFAWKSFLILVGKFGLAPLRPFKSLLFFVHLDNNINSLMILAFIICKWYTDHSTELNDEKDDETNQ